MSATGRHLAVQVLALVVTALLPACSKEARPDSHPIVGIYDRNAARIELVELIIHDQPRARKIKAKYEEIATLVESLAATRAKSSRVLYELSADRTLREDELRAEIGKMRAAGRATFEKYTALQLELRTMMTSEEFHRLDEVR
jgi:hypothetical protein